MGNVLISLDKKDEKDLRQTAKELFGNKKGALSKTVSLAIQDLRKKSKKRRAFKEMIKLMKEGIGLNLNGKKPYNHRSELYDR